MSKLVLVAVDGSEIALEALDEAADVCGDDTAYIVLEVTDPVDRVTSLSAAAFDPEIVRSALASMREEAERDVADAEARLRARGATEVEAIVAQGRAGSVIVEMARARQVDLVVLGTHGRSGLARTIMGSVADYVVRHLRGIPVLLHHPDRTED